MSAVVYICSFNKGWEGRVTTVELYENLIALSDIMSAVTPKIKALPKIYIFSVRTLRKLLWHFDLAVE